MLFNVFITNLAAYVEGDLVGKWIELPTAEEDITEVIESLKRPGRNDEEFFITDYENEIGLKIDEYKNIYELNEEAEELEDLDANVLKALLENGYDLDEAITIVSEYNYRLYPDCYNMSDVADAWLDETGDLDRIPEDLRDYFDYEAYGRMLDMSGSFYYIGNGTYLETW